MARRELFEISRSRTLRSRRASAASSAADLLAVGLNVESAAAGGERISCGGVSVVCCGCLLTRGMVGDFNSCKSGDGVDSMWVAERLLDCCEPLESIDDRLGDFLCGVK